MTQQHCTLNINKIAKGRNDSKQRIIYIKFIKKIIMRELFLTISIFVLSVPLLAQENIAKLKENVLGGDEIFINIRNWETKNSKPYNTPELVKKMIPSLQSAAGAKNVAEREWVTGAEDFSCYGTKAPSFFFYLGGMPKGNDQKKAPPHHTSVFYID
jgi:metal-dependent amidase/aminoacylase/carboxypeptidase family protein